MDNNLKVSVIIPCYNVERYLRRCMESVLRQDVPVDWYEVLLVDDGSTDGTPSICDEYAAKHAGVRVIHQKNTGVAAARNNGVAAAQGQLVAFLDSDDWWDARYMGRMLELVRECPDAGLYCCKYWYVKYGRAEDRIRDLRYTAVGSPYLDYFRSYYAGSSMPVWTGAVMMPRRVFEEMGGFPAEVRLGEDFLLWAKTAIHYPVACLDECLSYYYNDVPQVFRLTKRLQPPVAHMDWHLDGLEAECRQYAADRYADWSRLRDKLRATGLRAYWLSGLYHVAAAEELAKVDWTHLPDAYRQWYEKPVWRHKSREAVFRVLGRVKNLVWTLTRGERI